MLDRFMHSVGCGPPANDTLKYTHCRVCTTSAKDFHKFGYTVNWHNDSRRELRSKGSNGLLYQLPMEVSTPLPFQKHLINAALQLALEGGREGIKPTDRGQDGVRKNKGFVGFKTFPEQHGIPQTFNDRGDHQFQQKG